ncbi:MULTISPECIES: DUF2929 family protein [Virgibacillus]|uniref:DUF2929 family protein n=2 Tax=Virgibacillus TaxID=84406 RepID=A0A024QFC4_9BACI|nr:MULTISPECIES: DUF2929 family protein [Virgibacillus]EQB35181.1 hypothetical protein M948_18960 [Virgibacillus sp. CM-4]MYL42763.1 DUF2929 family protein [Virgibacillus massiliensis]GGJ69246.1 hypothetical protein GCM10007111_33650 [Virgibacillus kapii]CDQ40656.1 hypothetical protein BN990_02983 [Virgibacillus massiliensis]
MRYIATIIWALVISGVLSYVLSSMRGDSFSMMGTIVFAVIMFIAIVILGDSAIHDDNAEN